MRGLMAALLLSCGARAAPIASSIDLGIVNMLHRASVSHMQELNLEQVSAPPGPTVSCAACFRSVTGPKIRCRGCVPAVPQLEALYALLDDDGSGSLTVHEMIDLFVRLR